MTDTYEEMRTERINELRAAAAEELRRAARFIEKPVPLDSGFLPIAPVNVVFGDMATVRSAFNEAMRHLESASISAVDKTGYSFKKTVDKPGASC